MRRVALAALLLGLACAGPAAAETLVAASSPSEVRLETDFSGAEITVFGTVERDRVAISRADPYQIAVVVTGPRDTVVTRRKDRIAGLWINADSRTFHGAPGLYAVLTTAPFDDMGTPEALRQKGIGLRHLVLTDRAGRPYTGGEKEDPFRAALIRGHLNSGLYMERIGAVEFLSPTLFRAVLPLPANAPTGPYRIEVTLLQGGVPLAETTAALNVVKRGFEEWMYQSAFNRPLLYGLGTVIAGLFAGWIAGIIFRRD